ncbi:unnamed protein product [Auanema sp. JU1783]|nr:unnamed protein product [Auanema sp. JU1783]
MKELSVGKTVEHTIQGKFKILRHIYEGPFSDVFIVSALNLNHKEYAMKTEKQEGNSRPVLRLDVLVLMDLKGVVGFPKFIASGQTNFTRYCIMQLIGPDLGKLRRTLKEKKFSASTSLRILQQTLMRIETLHDAGWLSRDIKAPNFAIGVGQETSLIYMLDFGFSRKYLTANKVIVPARSSAALLGTFQYTSLASHEHKDQGRKDDLESWFYMAVELFKGPLPWSSINGHKDHQLIANWKKSIRNEKRNEFLRNIPAQFNQILNIIDEASFYDRPNYNKIQNLLQEAAKEWKLSLEESFEWEGNNRMIKKAFYVKELGESHLASLLMAEEVDLDTTPVDIETT